MFERKIIRRIYGPVMENNVWRIRYNEKQNTLLKGEDIVKFIKSQRIRWSGHVERMEDNAMLKRMLKGRLYSKRRKGRPRMARTIAQVVSRRLPTAAARVQTQVWSSGIL
jgi:hypothetical protein